MKEYLKNAIMARLHKGKDIFANGDVYKTINGAEGGRVQGRLDVAVTHKIQTEKTITDKFELQFLKERSPQ